MGSNSWQGDIQSNVHWLVATPAVWDVELSMDAFIHVYIYIPIVDSLDRRILHQPEVSTTVLISKLLFTISID